MNTIIRVFTSSGKFIGGTLEVDIEEAMETIKSHLENGNIVLVGSADDTKVDELDLY